MKCPRCGVEIKMLDLSSNCKKCGAHILYYTQEEDLKRDAQKTELEFASARLLVAKLKAAFMGGKISAVRIVFLLLTVLSLVIPVFNVKLSFPWWEYTLSVGGIGIYGIISDGSYNILLSFFDLGAGKELFILTMTAFILYILTVLCALVLLILFILSFVNIKKTAFAMTGLSVMGAVLSAALTALTVAAILKGSETGFVSVSNYYGSLAAFLMFAVLTVINIMLIKNIPVFRLSEADEKRLEIKRKLKAGEITLDELSLPVVEENKKEEKQKEKKAKRGKKK